MMDVLVCLAEHAGELVERQQLIDTVWATEFISENFLNRAIAKLKTLTNLRVVRDPDSPTGWNLTHDPFPAWERVPTW